MAEVNRKRKRKRDDQILASAGDGTLTESVKKQRAFIDKSKKPLSIKERKAADFYLESGNKMRSCIRAGYRETTARTGADVILGRAHVADYINLHQKARREAGDIKLEDQIHRINKVIETFDEIQYLSSKRTLGKNQRQRLYVLSNVVKGTTVLEAIRLQNELLGISGATADKTVFGPSFDSTDADL